MVPRRRRFVLGTVAAQGLWWARSARAAAPATLLGQPAQATDGETLRYEVLRALMARYAKAKGITATSAEIDAYLDQMRRTLQRDRERALQQRDALTQRLAAAQPGDAERQALTRELADATNTAQTLDSMLRGLDDPADRAARREVAAAFIVQWKIHRALYRQYGGRIGYQQGGPEPLDAVRRFLEAHQARGDFAIADPALAAAFWRYYRDDSIHSFYPRGSREEAQAFATPPWQAQ
jgi:hypothetical protein